MKHFDSIIITLILAVDIVDVWLGWRMLQERQRTKVRRIVNSALKHMRLSVRV